mmetsp:Transcript_97997/g.292760  ORF Transcript_97997/g.292760 Transcript_97997/m.292760 type:complete len:227 (-) Transcript_97997:1111-1791(-)
MSFSMKYWTTSRTPAQNTGTCIASVAATRARFSSLCFGFSVRPLKKPTSMAVRTSQPSSPSPSKDHAMVHQSLWKVRPVSVLTDIGSASPRMLTLVSWITPMGSSGTTVDPSECVTESPFATTDFPSFKTASTSHVAASQRTGVRSLFTTSFFPARLAFGTGLAHELPPGGSGASESRMSTGGVKLLNLCSSPHRLIVLVALLTTVMGTSWASEVSYSSAQGIAEA